MSETTVTQPPETQVTSKKVVKKTPSPKKSKLSFSDTPPGDRKKQVVKKLQQLGAIGASSARTFADLAERLGWTQKEVYGLFCGLSGKACSSPTCLVATGHAKIVTTQEGLAVHLTTKGNKPDFSTRPFSRGQSNGKPE